MPTKLTPNQRAYAEARKETKLWLRLVDDLGAAARRLQLLPQRTLRQELALEEILQLRQGCSFASSLALERESATANLPGSGAKSEDKQR